MVHSFRPGSSSIAPWGLLPRSSWVYRHTGQPLPRHFWRHEQWKTCWQRIVRRPVDSSMRSRHTGQVGSSIRAGVGGALGFVPRDFEGSGGACIVVLGELKFSGFLEGVKGSFVMSGKEESWPAISLIRNSMDLTKTTWQFSG